MKKMSNLAKAILISGIAVPAMGVLAHFVPGKGTFFLDDASLAHRFETAYTLRVAPDHRTYTSYEVVPHGSRRIINVNGVDKPLTDEGYVLDNAWVEQGELCDKLYNEENYIATPYLIYPLHLFVAWGAYAMLKRREEQMNTPEYNRFMKMKQNSR